MTRKSQLKISYLPSISITTYQNNPKIHKCEKINKTIIELTRQFISSKHTILTPAENDELAKIDWGNLGNQRQKWLVKHLITKVVYKDDEVRLEINRDANIDWKKQEIAFAEYR